MAGSDSPTQEGRGPAGADALEALVGGTARDLRTLQVKLTHVGSQSKPIPSVVFGTFYHLVRMDWFLPLRRPELHYANDESALWNFAVTPEEMERVVKGLRGRLSGLEAHGAEAPHLSLMLVLRDSRLGQHEYEAVLGRDQSAAVVGAVTEALDADNGVGRKVLALRQQVAG